LLEQVSEKSDKRVLEMIYSPAMLQELIMWNPDGNFDRVSALGMLMWHDATTMIHIKEEVKEVKSFLEHDYFKGMGVLRSSKTDEAAFSDFDQNFMGG
jgi:hypothetical protein